MTSSFRPTTFIMPAILAAMGTITVASAQSSSPFAKKNKVQAWELPQTPSVPTPSAPAPAPSVPAPAAPQSAPVYNPAPAAVTPQPDWQSYQAPTTSSVPQSAPQDSGVYYPGRANGGAARPADNIGNYETSARGARGTQGQSAFDGQNYRHSTTGSPQPQVFYHEGGNTVATPAYGQTPYGDPNQPQWGQPQWNGAPAQTPTQGQTQPQNQSQNQGQNQGQAYRPQTPDYSYEPQGAGNGLYEQQYDPQYKGRAPQYSQDQYAQQTQGALAPKPKSSWRDRLGFDKWKTIFRGSATGGVAGVDNANGEGGTSAEFIGDVDAEIEVNNVTQGGLEYGAVVGARAQYDRFRRGFGQRLPDCPPTAAGCSSADIDGVATGLRGHTSQFYSDGEDDAQDAEIQLETAYVFLRSAYGDVALGRDDGSAYLFSLGAPSLLKVGASNSPVDYTGLDSVKTVNDASGFAEKVAYTSPRLLGDTVGVGVQFGASYAPNAIGCGVDYCVESNFDQGSGTIAADLRNVVEVGVAFDRNFGNGLTAELTGTYARADERSGLAGLDDLSSFGVGLELTYDEWVLGGSYLNSNNGLADGDYEAFDVGLTWKPSKFGFTLGYGRAEDDNVNLTSDQAIFGVSYDFDKFTVGGGVQYIDRETSVFDGMDVTTQSEDATAIFLETGFKF